MTLNTGHTLLGRYRIVRLLGEGGMGAVYLAEDQRLGDRRCALKEWVADPNVRPQVLAELRRQFRAEASILADLDHPGLPRVTDYFSERGNEYIAMDFVEGEDLAAALKRHRGPLPERPVLIWADQVLDALEYLHGQRPSPIVHRDIKPANIILTHGGRIKLVDFGLVKLLDPNDPRTATELRGMGTPEYAPVEQYVEGGGHTDARSDIYSLGATLYHLVTGVSPPKALRRMVEPGVLVRPRRHNPRLSKGTETTVLKAMAVRTGDRFQTAQEMRHALSGRLAATAPEPSSARGGRATGPPSRRSLALVLGAAVVSLIIHQVLLQLYDPSPSTLTDGSDRGGTEHAALSHTPAPTVFQRLPAVTSAADKSATTGSPRAEAVVPVETVPVTVPSTVGSRPTGMIAFHSSRDGNDEIYIISADGNDQRRLTNDPADDQFAVLSPDGRRIVFSSTRSGNYEIYTMDVDGNGLTQLTDNPAEDRLASWSPDGRNIAFNSDRLGDLDLYVMNSDGSGTSRLTSRLTLEGHPTWSPDGHWIAFNAGATEEEWEIFVIPVTGGDWLQLTHNTFIDWSPSWSPVGDTLLFLSKRPDNADIYVMNGDGADQRMIYGGSGYEWGAAWSPDGQYVAFTSDVTGENEIYVMRSDGTEVRQLTRSGGAYPSWSR